MKAIINRIKEPSTLAGLSVLATLFGVPVGASDALVQVVGGIAALAAILLPEGKNA